MGPLISLSVTLLVLGVFLYMIVINVMELIAVTRLDKDDQPNQDAWLVWGLVFAGLMTGMWFVSLGGWIYGYAKPLDVMQDSAGSYRLRGVAGTTLQIMGFILLLNLSLFCIVFAMVFASA